MKLLRVAIAIQLIFDINGITTNSQQSSHYRPYYETDPSQLSSQLVSIKTRKLKWTQDRQDNSSSPVTCGGIIDTNTMSNGTIVFQPNSDLRQSTSSCRWILKINPGQKIIGRFSEFSVGNDVDNCIGGDYLNIGARPYVISGQNTISSKKMQTMGNKEIEKYKSMKYCLGNSPSTEFQSIADEFTLELMFQHQNRNLQEQDISVNDIGEYKSNIVQEKGTKRISVKGTKNDKVHQRTEAGSFTFEYWLETNEATCGDKMQESQFLFKSQEYPSAIPNVTMSCGVTVNHDCENPVCQLRLDLLDFELAQPDLGDCNRDQFIIRGDEPLPVLCGKNSGQHLFVDVRGRKETDINVLTTPMYPKPVGNGGNDSSDQPAMDWMYELANDRKWNIRVTQIPCDCTERPDVPEMEPAPAGCLQHFRGIAGMVASFNYDGKIRNLEPCYAGIDNEINCNDTIFTGHLNNLDYTICIESETGYCGIAYTPEKEYAGGDLSWSGFQMDGTSYERRNPDLEFPPKFGEYQCKEDYIQIPRGHHAEDVGVRYPAERYCGVKFGNRVEGAVISHTRPMILRVKMDGQELESGVATNDRGFNLNFQQIPCSASKSDAINFT